VLLVVGFLVLFVGLPLAVWWWVGDILREKLQESEGESFPETGGQVTRTEREEETQCPY
jgi:hypothetical protein